jgi:COP9 signalosome complex subunit 6
MARTGVNVHPLVLVNIADHLTRTRQTPDQSPQLVRAIGAFVGVQEGVSVSVLDSMEAKVEFPSLTVNIALLKRKVDLTLAVFPRFELLGWYLVGPMLSDQEMLAVHKQMQELNESPLVLIMDEQAARMPQQTVVRGKKQVLPITVYETVMQIVNDQPVQTFVEVPVRVETTEPERITVDHVITQRGTGASGGDSSTLNPHMTALKNAVQMLKGRILILKKFLESTKAGQIPPDHELLREADAICNQLPALDPALIKFDFNHEMADALLVSLLASVTKETAAMGSILDKFFMAYPTPGAPPEKPQGPRGTSKRNVAPSKGRMN